MANTMQTTSNDPALQFWQQIDPAGTHPFNPDTGYLDGYPATLSDGSELLLPIRERDNGQFALASLIINQASFTVVDALASELAEQLSTYQPDLIVGVPTLGLTLAEATARKLGHAGYLPLGTSRKFWYQDSLSVPMSSITSPGAQKRLYIDPRLLPLLEGKRICVIDDAISTGSSIVAALSLLSQLDITPVCLGFAMRQSNVWKQTLKDTHPGMENLVCSAFHSPKLIPITGGGWTIES
ncbi:phosphoribosyltransferase [Granulosicoccus antarcticus]|uniref:Orotate phosphoribosyltransferase n=1 Tax=Granulosicoccus antarcticus IMCC3135 TaxID=1192854 RepID=A0A2Z2NZ78_9GAMM|nr:phosphoribosyltransferase [Granulosicoccus antarcticus]ASJ74180.1 Orotate phosphoribosyltransferase [Granulosicoccus antarcticus IMCC3135]